MKKKGNEFKGLAGGRNYRNLARFLGLPLYQLHCAATGVCERISGKMIQIFGRGTFWGDMGLQLHALSAGIFYTGRNIPYCP
ncbi:MAG: hypothetical protein LBG96_08960 [Tannerella sp.]|nr:hypothetical protein [Tannerella sp.]